MKTISKFAIVTFTSAFTFLLSLVLLTTMTASANATKGSPNLKAEVSPSVPLKATGGADGYGYTYQDEQEVPFGPTYVFTDISGTGGTNLLLDDDSVANITALDLAGFNFQFYGVSLSSLLVSNNGAMLVNPPPSIEKISYSNACPLSGASSDHPNLIASWWDDWDDAGDVYWQLRGTAPNRQLIVQWNNMIHVPDTLGEGVTFQVVLFETSNLILFQYQDTNAGRTIINNGNSGTIGILADGTNFLQYETCNGGDPLTANRAIRFQRSSITIVKDAIPDNDTQDFAFSGSGMISSTFSLDDDADPALPASRTFYIAPNNYAITETVPTGWDLTGLNCVGGATTSTSGSTVNITLAPDENVTCTFENTKLATITIEKISIPTDDPQDFSFTATGPSPIANFQLDDDSTDGTLPDNRTFNNLKPGSYSITEGAVGGWGLVGLTCTEDGTNNSSGDTGARTANINLEPGETVNCVFTNSQLSTIIIEKVSIPTNDPQDFDFTATGPSPIANFQLDDDSTDGALPDNRTFNNLTPGSYTIQEGAVTGWDLTTLTCNDPTGNSSGDTGTRTATINVAAGETVSCTFENTKRGTIEIVKDAVPDHAQDFSFTGSGGIGNFDLDDDTDGTLSNTATFSVTPGNYTVQEGGPVANWTLQNINCVDPTGNSSGDTGTRTATINVAAGETVSCTFTNQPDPGTISIEKISIPTDDPQDFSFTATGPSPIANFQLDDDSTDGTLPDNRTFNNLTPGTYTIQEAAVTNWAVTGLTCNDPTGDSSGDTGTRTATIKVEPGEAVTCTFENIHLGTIIIEKVSIPTDDPQDFSFMATGPSPIANFQLDDDSTDGTLPDNRTFNNLTPGSYTIQEGAVTGWDLTTLTCNDPTGNSNGDTGTRTATINVAAGETVSCTFENTKRGTIEIVKDAVPDHAQDFSFTGSGGIGNFDLDDDTDGTLSNTATFSVTPGNYTVQEGGPVANWTLQNINCVDPTGNSSGDTGTRTATINVATGETVSCTFTNQADPGTISIEKVSTPTDDPRDFDFTATGPTPIANFQLDDDSTDGTLPDNRTFNNLTPGTYTIQEAAVTNWAVTGLTCNDPTGDSSGDTGTRTATIKVEPGEAVTCTFENIHLGTIIIEKVSIPTDDPQDFSFMATGPSPIANFQLDDDSTDGTLPDNRTFNNLTPGSYTIQEGAVTGWDLTTLTCNDPTGNSNGDTGTRTATINVAAAETVTCTFTNTAQPGEITIVKDANPDDPQDFAFIGSGSIGNFDLDDDADPTLLNTRTFNVPHGNYTVVEGATMGWSLSNLVCNDPSGDTTTQPSQGRANIALEAGESITCTFTNTVNTSVGAITIVKDAVPDNNTQAFAFSGDLGNFSLVDNGNPFSNTLTQLNLTAGTYAVTEAAVAGWNLTGLSCNDPDGGTTTGGSTATIDLDVGENITCVFTNTATNSITIIKEAIPEGTQSFAFTGNLGNFSLVDDGNPSNNSQSFSVSPGTYVVTETAVTDWNLTGLSCNDPDGGSTTAGSTATIDLDVAENITCTFTNQAATATSGTVYLPIVMNDFNSSLPPVPIDLTVSDVTVSNPSPNTGQAVEISVTLHNTGSAFSTPFWVDLYLSTAPINPTVNQTWDEDFADGLVPYGVAWKVYGMPADGDTIITNLNPNDLIPGGTCDNYSNFIPNGLGCWPQTWKDIPLNNYFRAPGTYRLYVQVDSWDEPDGTSANGEVVETNEGNNLFVGPTIAVDGIALSPDSATLTEEGSEIVNDRRGRSPVRP